ncbi:hypothetical protein SUGI_0101920 [Cryptomeria japonica]|nr:hypothetical protein SUGI_0101920 [Cryptomeria japonica]
MAHSDVCPENLRFTQDSIKNKFKEPYEHQRIDVAVDQIGSEELNPEVLMPLTVVHHKNVLWSLDNRRLWVLRKAGVPTVKVIWVPPNYNRRSEEFFSSLSDPLLERKYSSADYFPRVRGGLRFVDINRSGAPPLPIPLPLNHPTTVAGAAQASRTSPPPPPSPPPPSPSRPLDDITVRNSIPPLVSSLPNASYQTPKKAVPMIPNENSGPGGKKGSDSLWGKILNAVNYVMDEGFGFFCFIPPRFFHFNLSNLKLKVVRLGKIVLFVLVFFFVVWLAYNLLKIIAIKGIVGMGKMVSNLLSKIFCFLRFVMRNAVDLSRGVVVCSGLKTLDTCGVILSQCISRLRFITGQLAVRLGTKGIPSVSLFCPEKFQELLRFIQCQAFGLAGEKLAWSLGKLLWFEQDSGVPSLASIVKKGALRFWFY